MTRAILVIAGAEHLAWQVFGSLVAGCVVASTHMLALERSGEAGQGTRLRAMSVP